MRRETDSHIALASLLLVFVIAAGTFGYVALEGWSVADSLYMVILAVTTTGFQEVRPLSPQGRLLTSGIIVFGLLAIGYLAGRVAQLLIESYLFRRRRMERKLKRIRNHYIVCGYGRMGFHICEDLLRAKAQVVVIERDETLIQALSERGVPFVHGDSSSDEILQQANIATARGLITVVSSDPENVFTTLSARSLRPDLLVVSRALTDEAESKLRKAGANRVIKPYEEVGRRMAQMLLRPGVVEFMDTVAERGGKNINLEEVMVREECKMIGRSLRDLPLRTELNIIVVAINRKGGEFIYNPGPEVALQAEDRMIVIGDIKALELLAERFL